MFRFASIFSTLLVAAVALANTGGDAAAVPDSAKAKRPMIIAHRGASGKAPENTVSAYKLAWEMNADAAEVDVYLTKDGRIVCLHDRSLKRTTSVDRPVTEMTWEELKGLDAGSWKSPAYAGEPVPLLEEVLATMPPGKKMLVEIKDGPRIVPALKEVIEKSPARSQIIVISFSKEVLDAVRAAMPDVPIQWLLGADKRDDGTYVPVDPAKLDLALKSGFQNLSVSFRGVSPELVEACRRANSDLYVWTVNDMEMAKEFANMGIAGITSDHPDRLRQTLEAMGK